MRPLQRTKAFFSFYLRGLGSYLKLVWHFILSTKWKQRNTFKILGGRALTTSGENAVWKVSWPAPIGWLKKKKKRETISFPSGWIDLISKERNGRDAFHIGMCILWAGVKGIDRMVIWSWLMLLNKPTSPGAATLICTLFTGFCTSR